MNTQQLNKECPYCGEQILIQAKKCKHCGEILDHQMRDLEILKQGKQIIVNNNNNNNNNLQSLRSFPHGWHLLFTILSGGAWIIIWIIHYIFRNKSKYY